MTTSNFKLQPGSKVMCVAKSGAGKTEFARKLLLCRDSVFVRPPDRIVFHYRFAPDWRAEHERDVEFTRELPRDLFDEEDGDLTHKLLIVDDCHERDFPAIADIFLRSGRHSRVTTVVNYQSLFHKSQEFRSMMQNADLLVLFHMTRALAQVSLLCRQVFPDKRTARDVVELYKKKSSRKGGYLVFDFRLDCGEYPIRTNVFPSLEDDFESVFRS
jgi:hypothetical protein